MKVTGAFLAESAEVLDGKLTVRGGFLRSYRAGIDRVATVTLVLFTRTDEPGGQPQVTIELTTPDGDSQAERVTLPQDSRAGEVSFAGWPLWIPVEIDGDYLLSASTDEGSVTVRLTVHGDD